MVSPARPDPITATFFFVVPSVDAMGKGTRDLEHVVELAGWILHKKRNSESWTRAIRRIDQWVKRKPAAELDVRAKSLGAFEAIVTARCWHGSKRSAGFLQTEITAKHRILSRITSAEMFSPTRCVSVIRDNATCIRMKYFVDHRDMHVDG